MEWSGLVGWETPTDGLSLSTDSGTALGAYSETTVQLRIPEKYFIALPGCWAACLNIKEIIFSTQDCKAPA